MKVADLFAKLNLKFDKKSFKAANKGISKLKLAVGSLAAGLSIRFMKNLITDTAAAADNFNKMSKKVGIASETLQQLEFAAEISGTNLATLRTGLQRFARSASDVPRGVKDAIDGFKDLGVNVKAPGGGLKALDVLLLEVSDRFKDMPDGTLKTATAMRLFGRAGADMIPLLNEGSAGIAKLQEEFVGLGAQIDSKTGAQFEQMNDDLLRVKVAFRGLRNQAVVALLPQIQKLIKGFLVWVKANRKLIKQRLETVLKLMIFAFGVLGKVLGTVIDILSLFSDHLEALAIAIGSIVVGMKIMAAASVRAALASAVSWIAATLPLILMGVLVAALVLIVDDLWHAFTGGESVFKDMYEAAKEWIGDKLVGVIVEAAEVVNEQFENILERTGGSGAIAARALRQKRLRSKFSPEELEERGEKGDFLRRLNRDKDKKSLKDRLENRKLILQSLKDRNGPQERIQQYTAEVRQLKGERGAQIQNTITVNMQSGDAQEVASAVEQKMNFFFTGKLREASAATE